MTQKRNTELLEQLTWHWTNQLRPRLDGLTDEEYLWEPVRGAWNLRPRGQARTEHFGGSGKIVVEFAFPEPTPVPVTTIAWRLAHVIVGVLGMRRPVGPAEGPWAQSPYSALVLHIHREVIHHCAEIALLRDLWAQGMR